MGSIGTLVEETQKVTLLLGFLLLLFIISFFFFKCFFGVSGFFEQKLFLSSDQGYKKYIAVEECPGKV